MQVGSRYVAAAVKRAAPPSQTKMMRLIAPKMWITVTTIATDQSDIQLWRRRILVWLGEVTAVPRVLWSFVQDARPRAGLTARHGAYRIDTQHDG